MVLLQIDSVHGYKPRPDFMFRVHANGQVEYTGRYYVGMMGKLLWQIESEKTDQIKLLLEYLKKRNQKNYLKRISAPIYKVVVGEGLRMQFEIDESDIVSEDIIKQIMDLSGVRMRVYAALDLYLVLNKPEHRSRELGMVRATDADQAIGMYLKDRRSQQFKSSNDFWAFPIGRQKPNTLHNPLIYFTFSDYQIQKNSLKLFLNQGKELTPEPYNVYIFISFGKRYNDPKASYFLVLAPDASEARKVLHTQFPHFMSRDFQLVDAESSYQPIPMFTSQIPIAIR